MKNWIIFRIHSVSIVLLFLMVPGYPQYFDLGQDPASIQWKQIRTKNFQIIFPDYYEAKAQYFVAGLEQVTEHGFSTITSKPRRLPVIFHTQTVNSNAMVPWAPRRMEVYTPPPQDNYSQPWLDQLILHEYRHVQQIEKMNQGFTKALYYIFGEQAAAAMIGLFVPFWFLEGDAVTAETGWSRSGRGRDPSFTMPLRAQVADKGIYSYDKAVYGSYKDFVPNHYILGYHLVGLGRITYGPQLWEYTVNTAARKPFMLVPLNHGLKEFTGMPKATFYRAILSRFDSIWNIQSQMTTNNHESQLITINIKKTHTNYRHPFELTGKGILSEKSGLDDVNRYVIIDTEGKESVLLAPGFNFDQTLSSSQHLITWAARKQDPRWSNRSYSVIKVHDMLTGKTCQLTRKSRMFAPALSNDASRIVVIELDSLDQSRLAILDAASGSILHKAPAPDKTFLATPVWSEEDNRIVMIGINNNGKALLMYNMTTGMWSNLTPWSFSELYLPRSAGGFVYFTGGYTGVDNIYAVDTNDLSIYQVTDDPFGATDASISTDHLFLYYSSYTGDGYDVRRLPLRPDEWKPMDPSVNMLSPVADSLSALEKYIFDGPALNDSHYISKPYRDWKNLFNIHSWGPFSVEVDNQEFYPGVSVMSQNKLSTAFTTLGYRYNLNEETGTFYADFSYRGLYPVFDITYEIGNRAGTYTNTEDPSVRFTWRENNLRTSVSVPLSFLLSRWYAGLQPTIGSTFIYIKHNESTPHSFIEGKLQSMEYRLLAYTQIESSYRDIYPKWGMTIDLNYRNTPFGGNSLGNIWSAETYVYLPGLFKHQGFRLYGGYQHKNPGNYRFADLINFPRGYSDIYLDEAVSFSAGYKFPFLYPDITLGPVLYIKRLKASVFWDYATGEYLNSQNQVINEAYQSLGLDITADMHVLRFLAPFDLGLRTIYLPENSDFVFEFLFSINVDSFY